MCPLRIVIYVSEETFSLAYGRRCHIHFAGSRIRSAEQPWVSDAMSFSTQDKERALVAAARRCCVCKKYKGVGVEVHHIVPRASGGADDYDNAIVLCFDCHSAAGHYNTKHPRGTKFSPRELKKHRNDWYERVRTSGIASLEPSDAPSMRVRYVLTLDTRSPTHKPAARCVLRRV